MLLYHDIQKYKTLKLIKNKNQTEFNTNKGNWIIIDGDYNRIILNDYKGSKRKPQYIISRIPDSVINYRKGRPIGRYIFDRKHRSSQGFTTLLCDTFEKYTKKRVGINILRKSYVSNLFKENPHMSERNKGAIATEMGTSIRMLNLVHRKV